LDFILQLLFLRYQQRALAGTFNHKTQGKVFVATLVVERN